MSTTCPPSHHTTAMCWLSRRMTTMCLLLHHITTMCQPSCHTATQLLLHRMTVKRQPSRHTTTTCPHPLSHHMTTTRLPLLPLLYTTYCYAPALCDWWYWQSVAYIELLYIYNSENIFIESYWL